MNLVCNRLHIIVQIHSTYALINIFDPFQEVQDDENGTEVGELEDVLDPGPSKKKDHFLFTFSLHFS